MSYTLPKKENNDDKLTNEKRCVSRFYPFKKLKKGKKKNSNDKYRREKKYSTLGQKKNQNQSEYIYNLLDR